jgi:hypothetical protein
VTPRFALLRHTLPDGSAHFDLLIEHPEHERVPTWRLAENPVDHAAVAAERIADHRPVYLDYAGPVSGDRGHVDQIDAGTATWEAFAAEHVVILLSGRRLSGPFTISNTPDGLRLARRDA